MNAILRFIKKDKFFFIGGFVGGVGGYLYWYYVGCGADFCPVVSSLVMSIIWGALLVGTLFSAVTPKNTRPKADDKAQKMNTKTNHL